MRTTWEEDGRPREVRAPLSLVVSAFAPCDDVRGTWTPQLRSDRGADRAAAPRPRPAGRARLGGSILAQVFGETGHEAPDVDDPERIRRALRGARRAARARAWCSPTTTARTAACSRRSREMAFAGHVRAATWTCCAARRPAARRCRACSPRSSTRSWACVLQVRAADREHVRRHPRAPRPRRAVSIGAPNRATTWCASRAGTRRCSRSRARRCSGSGPRPRWRMQSLRDNPESAREEYDRILDPLDPGLAPRLTFDPAENVALPFVAKGARPRLAVLREQGVNGQVEMAAAFDRAGFDARRRAHERPRRGPRLARRLRGLRGLRRLLVRRRAGRRRGLGEVDPVQRARARRVRRVLRPPGQLRARRVQRLPDDERARASSSRAPPTGRAS